MPLSKRLRAVIPDNLFPLTVSIDRLTETRDAFGGRDDTWEEIEGMTDLPCLFTHAVRGSVRDIGLRKDNREYVREKAGILVNALIDVPYGARARITWSAEEFPPNGKIENWRVIGIEHRPMSDHTRLPIEQMDGLVRT